MPFRYFMFPAGPACQAARFHWRRAEGADALLLRDAFDDVNSDPAAWRQTMAAMAIMDQSFGRPINDMIIYVSQWMWKISMAFNIDVIGNTIFQLWGFGSSHYGKKMTHISINDHVYDRKTIQLLGVDNFQP